LKEFIEKILIDEEMIESAVRRLGREITEKYKVKKPVLIGILKGCFIFLADLVRNIELDIEIDFMAVSSYGEATESTGVVRITKDLHRNIMNKDVILVDDIIDTGLTMHYLKQYLSMQSPKSIAFCAMLSKPSRRKIDIEIDFCGYEIEDYFVVGYGLGHKHRFRQLPYIGVLKEEYY